MATRIGGSLTSGFPSGPGHEVAGDRINRYDRGAQTLAEPLERSKREWLSEDEQAELDRFGELEHLMQLGKVRARRFAT